MSLPQI